MLPIDFDREFEKRVEAETQRRFVQTLKEALAKATARLREV